MKYGEPEISNYLATSHGALKSNSYENAHIVHPP